mmetsp:Transcript_91082/g.292234  ORF Transcript_91082/g.292234 Transcript_91082/m.292234 type:complete len:161 (+) Transcript_91082:713-1195(+)
MRQSLLSRLGSAGEPPPPEKAKSEARKRKNNEIHAEVQMLARCARAGISVEGCWLYVALPPCWECSKAIVAAGIYRVVFQDYPQALQGHAATAGSLHPGIRQQLLAEAAGVSWAPLPRMSDGGMGGVDADGVVQELWGAYKEERGLDRAKLWALSSEEPF